MAKHFELEIADGAFAYTRKHEQIAAEAALDGFYVIRTTCTTARLPGPAAVVRAYKQLKVAERAFRTMKDQIEIRPIHHHLEDRVRAHAFLCMLAYYVAFELHQRLTPLLFTDEHTDSPRQTPSPPPNARPPPRPRPAAPAPPTDTPPTASPTCSPNSARSAATSSGSVTAEHTYTRLTKPTELQARAFELLDVKLA